jgi:predicted transcriptional regulator of viral defense system
METPDVGSYNQFEFQTVLWCGGLRWRMCSRHSRSREIDALQNVFIYCHLGALCNTDRVATNHTVELLKLVRKLGLLRPRDLQTAGIPRVYLKKLVDGGELLKTGRGLYVCADAALTENHSLAEAAKLVPKGVVCLLSALRFHDLTTENPAEVWVAIPRGTRPPRSSAPALRIARFSAPMMATDIERHVIQGVSVPVYSIAKTIADCFRFRNRIGVNIAVEALRDAWRKKQTTSEELWRCAEVCRVLNVMRPYFDSLE